MISITPTNQNPQLKPKAEATSSLYGIILQMTCTSPQMTIQLENILHSATRANASQIEPRTLRHGGGRRQADDSQEIATNYVGRWSWVVGRGLWVVGRGLWVVGCGSWGRVVVGVIQISAILLKS